VLAQEIIRLFKEDKSRTSDWEGGTMESAGKNACIAAFVDRKTKFLLEKLMPYRRFYNRACSKTQLVFEQASEKSGFSPLFLKATLIYSIENKSMLL
jgi:IS30 family transposase